MTPSVSRGANNACNHWINGGVDDCKCDTEGVTDTSCGCSWCLQSVADCGNCDSTKHLMNIPYAPAFHQFCPSVMPLCPLWVTLLGTVGHVGVATTARARTRSVRVRPATTCPPSGPDACSGPATPTPRRARACPPILGTSTPVPKAPPLCSTTALPLAPPFVTRRKQARISAARAHAHCAQRRAATTPGRTRQWPARQQR